MPQYIFFPAVSDDFDFKLCVFDLQGSQIERWEFISQNIEEMAVRRPQNPTVYGESHRTRSLQYTFEVKGDRVKVCKTMFLQTLAVSKKEMVNALSAMKIKQ